MSLTFKFEREVVGQMSTFVVTAEEEECVRVPDLERPEVQDALFISFSPRQRLQLTSIEKYPRST